MKLGIIINPKGQNAYTGTGTGPEYSNAGGDWIGAIATAVSGIVQGGFQYGANKENNEAAVSLQELMGRQQAQQQAAANLNNSSSSQILAAALASMNNNNRPTESAWTKNLLPIALIAGAAALVIFFVLKSDK